MSSLLTLVFTTNSHLIYQIYTFLPTPLLELRISGFRLLGPYQCVYLRERSSERERKERSSRRPRSGGRESRALFALTLKVFEASETRQFGSTGERSGIEPDPGRHLRRWPDAKVASSLMCVCRKPESCGGYGSCTRNMDNMDIFKGAAWMRRRVARALLLLLSSTV
jgi:hypothetical protein